MNILFDTMTTSYKILIEDRNYTDWNLHDGMSLQEVSKLDINPSSLKLFSGDTFEYIPNDMSVNESQIRIIP